MPTFIKLTNTGGTIFPAWFPRVGWDRHTSCVSVLTLDGNAATYRCVAATILWPAIPLGISIAGAGFTYQTAAWFGR